jgi:hypothetical protein
MFGYNSHDCHMMMMFFLTIAIRVIKLIHIKVLITRLFNTISQKVIGRKELGYLKAYMIETMCMLEICFPPFLYARTPNDASRVSDPHIGPIILT